MVVSLVFAGCRMESDPLVEGEPYTLDERLYGVWQFKYGIYTEEYSITRSGTLGTLTYGTRTSSGFKEDFAGDIVYAQNFGDSTGIIIIRYKTGHELQWIDWSKVDNWENLPADPPLRPDHPTGKSYYGIYFTGLNSGGTQVMLANTNDQTTNYGPTETATLEEAIEKFTQGSMNQMMDQSVGDPQTKVKDY
jgi:hypothetical protein